MSEGHRRLAPYPFELAALLFALAVGGGLAALGAPPSVASLSGQLRLTLMMLVLAWLLGVAGRLAWRLVSRQPLRAYLARVIEPSWLLLWVRLWLACMLTSYAYFWLKVCVPLLNARLWDGQLWRLDRLLHFDVSPGVAMTTLLPPSPALSFLDYWYGLWLLTLVAGISFFAAGTDPSRRRGFLLSCVLVWAVGACLYAALPALGPAFAFPGQWQTLPAQLPIAAATQELLWGNYQLVIEARSGALPAFDHTRGVAALPSLHVAFHALFALWAWRESRALAALFGVMTLLTFVGSLRTGWHYAVDGYLGLLLAWGAYAVARRLEREVSPAAAPRRA